jgi:Ser/Thr protein kinase RdoA (MazF antagonist)
VLEAHARETAAAFGLGEPVVLVGPVAAGRQGRIWRLETDRARYAVKVSDVPPDPGEVECEAAYQEEFSARGVPMPAVVRAVDGSVLADVAGHRVRVYSWVDVLGEDRRLDPAGVGILLASLHRVRIPAPGPVDPWFREPVGVSRWAAVVADLRQAGAPFADQLAGLVPGILDAEAQLEPPRDLQVCHRDLWADNLRATAAGALVALDWENAGPADPSQELGMVLFEYACGEPDRARRLLAAYVDAGGPGRLHGLGDFSMLVAVQGHIVQEGCRRWLAASTADARADNAAWVAEFLDDPFLVPQLGAMLRVVRPVG